MVPSVSGADSTSAGVPTSFSVAYTVSNTARDAPRAWRATITMQRDVRGVVDQRDQRRQRRAAGEPFVVVDDQEDVGGRPPPGTAGDVLAAHRRRREPALQPVEVGADHARRVPTVRRGGDQLIRQVGQIEEPTGGVEDDEPGFVQAVPGGDLPDQLPQHRRAAGLLGAEDHQVLIGLRVPEDRLQVLVQAERVAQVRIRIGRQVSGPDDRRQQLHPRGRRSGPSGGDGADQLGRRCGEPLAAADAVDPGHRGQQVQPVPGQAAARPVLRDTGGDLRVDLGIQRVAEPQLDPGTDQILEGGTDLRPPAGRDHQMDAVVQTPRGHRGELRLEGFEELLHRAPAVDHQDDVTEAVAGDGTRADPLPPFRRAIRPRRG